MLPDRVSNPGPLTYESGALLIALRGPASQLEVPVFSYRTEGFHFQNNPKIQICLLRCETVLEGKILFHTTELDTLTCIWGHSSNRKAK